MDTFNPYDLSEIAKICRKHQKKERKVIAAKPPYEPEHFCSAYDLSNRPGDDD